MKDFGTKNFNKTFNNVIYEEIDSVSVASCLRSTLDNVITNDLEIKVVNSLFKDGLLKFYIRYVDDTFALIMY